MDSASTATAWEVDTAQLPADASPDDTLRFALRYAVLAPSNHNTQPWRFVLGTGSVALCADRLRALPIVDPFDRELIISCGAALFNLRVALSHFGLASAIDLFPAAADPDLLANLRIVPDGRVDPTLPELFDAITMRVTTRAPFAAGPVDDRLVQQLAAAAHAEGVDFACIRDPDTRAQIAALVARADREQFADTRFRHELASWIHTQRSGDGMPAYAAGVPSLLDFAAPLAASVVRTFDLGNGIAATHHQLVEGSPLIAGFATGSDDREAWLATGEALERVLLVAAKAGLTASYLNQPIEAEWLRDRLSPLLGLAGTPQLLLRIGRGPRVAHAPRRAFGDVVS